MDNRLKTFLSFEQWVKDNSIPDQARAIAWQAWQAALASQWQPIETAPKDWTNVLICCPNSSRRKVKEAYWATPYESAPADECWWSTPHGPAGRGYIILPEHVTHWMPLPPEPAK